MSYDEYESRRTISLPLIVAGLAVVAAIGNITTGAIQASLKAEMVPLNLRG